MNERPLFDVAALATRCPICGCTRQPNQHRTPDCGIDQSWRNGDYGIKRPNECLNKDRPETDPIPY